MFWLQGWLLREKNGSSEVALFSKTVPEWSRFGSTFFLSVTIADEKNAYLHLFHLLRFWYFSLNVMSFTMCCIELFCYYARFIRVFTKIESFEKEIFTSTSLICIFHIGIHHNRSNLRHNHSVLRKWPPQIGLWRGGGAFIGGFTVHVLF